MEANLTQKQVAEKLFVSDKTISAYENGQNEPDLTTLKKLANIFGTTLSKLIERSEQLMKTRKTKFYIEAFGEENFEGYTFGKHWNGFECPCFEKETALQIVDAWNKLDKDWEEGYFAWYDKESDAFCFKDPNHTEESEPEVYEGYDVQFEGKIYHVYGIGSYGWTWGEEEK